MAQDNEQQGGRGFAGMSKDKQREIASRGGKAAHQGDNRGETTEGGTSDMRNGGTTENR